MYENGPLCGNGVPDHDSDQSASTHGRKSGWIPVDVVEASFDKEGLVAMRRYRDAEGSLDGTLRVPARLKEDAGRVLNMRSPCQPGYHCRSEQSGYDSPGRGQPPCAHTAYIPRSAGLTPRAERLARARAPARGGRSSQGRRVLVLQPSELALHGRAPAVEALPLGADFKRRRTKYRCPTGECEPKSTWLKASRLHPLVPRDSRRFRDLYAGRSAVEREFGRLKHDYGLAPLRVRGLERVRLHADLTMMTRLAQALNRARAVPLAA